MNDRFKFRIAVYERQQNNMPWEFVEYIDPDNQHWGLNQCGDMISDSFYSAHYTRKNAPDSVHRVYEPEMSTGLKDNCGNLIYEGDIIGDGEDDYIIKWDSNRTMFVAEDIDTSYEIEDVLDPTICVIGNVHNQPE